MTYCEFLYPCSTWVPILYLFLVLLEPPLQVLDSRTTITITVSAVTTMNTTATTTPPMIAPELSSQLQDSIVL